ncbi:MAG TPA: hypothetical protein QF499_06130 [Gammaproteobacteria bacterium]|jgi:hypothetical protein|nr:hypothetical protein [Gammaproteobacteria bacterium]MDP7297105.1 hypothetical protein [Gammaproteobacteria bacterium]MDP7661432.1 hypothetical protein [Gammaproteobacteria bacterium]HJP38695.1 hypothetical protein [Gammaproteobacteria bacterium]
MRRVFLWVTACSAILLFGQIYAGSLGGELSADENFGHTLTLFLHQLLLVYWLGPDIAVYIWSRRVVNTGLSVEQRIVAGNMMTMIDIVPRVCLSLFLTVAGILSETYGLAHPWWQMIAIVLLGPVWLTIVLMSYLKRGSDFGDLVMRFDCWLRGLLVIGMPISVIWSVSAGRLADSPWIAGKLIILAIVILLGLLLRLRLRAMFDGLNRMEKEGQTEAVDTVMTTSLARAQLFSFAIWALLLWASLLGVVKPGEPASGEPVARLEWLDPVRSLSSLQ